MKSDIEIKDIIYSIIKGSTLESAVNGKLYKDSRPTNSGKEDILISVLEGMNGLYQEMIVNINIYTQDVTRGSDSIENSARIRDLTRLAIDLLDGCITGEYRIVVKKQNTFEVKETLEHATNIQLSLTFKNF